MNDREEERPCLEETSRFPTGRTLLRQRVAQRTCSPGIPCRGSFIVWIGLVLWGMASASHAQDVTEEQALAWFRGGHIDQAQAAFQQILAIHPQEPTALYHLGQMASDDADAEQYYLRLLYHAPDHHYADDTLLALARLYYQHKRYREAAQMGNRLLTSYPDTRLNDQTRYWLGRALMADHQPTLARLTFLQLLTVHPQSPYTVHTRLAIADTYRSEGAFIEAARSYLRFESDDVGSDSLHVALFRAGQCLEKAGKQIEAGHVYRRLISRFPDSPEAREAQRLNKAHSVVPTALPE